MPKAAARHLSIRIDVPFEQAYAYAQVPEHFSDWAAGLAKTLHRRPQGWVADTPEGEASIEFSPPNPYGVLDHRVRLSGKPEVMIPLRMIPHGYGTEVLFTLLRQPGMDDAAFERDADAVRRDLAALKSKLESSADSLDAPRRTEPATTPNALQLARDCYRAYATKDRALVERLIHADYRFTSPLDNAIDRETYLQRCWPDSENVDHFDFVLELEQGDHAVVVYEGHTRDGKVFRNCETHRARDGKLIATEVYFGWNLPHPAAPGGFIADAGTERVQTGKAR